MKINIIAVSATLLLFGCEYPYGKYELQKTERGLVRLDKKSGDILIIDTERGKAYPVDLIGESEIVAAERRDAARIDRLARLRNLPEVKLPGLGKDLSLNIYCRWVDGSMDYRVELSPYIDDLWEKALRNPDNKITLIFRDKDYFKVYEMPAPLSSMIRIVGEDLKAVSFRAEGTVSISRNQYEKIETFAVLWVYSEELKKLAGGEKKEGQNNNSNP